MNFVLGTGYNIATNVAFSETAAALLKTPSPLNEAVVGAAPLGGLLNLVMINRDLPIDGALQYRPDIAEKPALAISLAILRRALSIGLSLLETTLGHLIIKRSSEGLAEQLKNQTIGAALLIVAFNRRS